MKLENVALRYKDQEGGGARTGDTGEKPGLPGAGNGRMHAGGQYEGGCGVS